MRKMRSSTLAFFAAIALVPSAKAQTCAQPIDFNDWTMENYAWWTARPGPVWSTFSFGLSVSQGVRVQGASVYYADFKSDSYDLEGTVNIDRSGSIVGNALFGFVLGFEPGDATNPNAQYLLFDWAGPTTTIDYEDPSCGPGEQMNEGLAVSTVFGIPTADEFAGHVDRDVPCSPLGQGVAELLRGATLGSQAWVEGYSHTIRLEVRPGNTKFYVDDVLEISVPTTGALRPGLYCLDRQPFYTRFTVTQRAASVNYGAGWPGTTGEPGIRMGQLPVLGSRADIVMTNSANRPEYGNLWFGSSKADMSTPFGGSILVGAPLFLIPVPLMSVGESTIPFGVPNDATLCGMSFYAQLIQTDAGASAGVAFSDGLEAIIGQ